MIEWIGWTGALLFSWCAVPQCLKTWRTRRADDLSWGFLLMWLWGEVFTLAYVLATNARTGDYQLPLLTNYAFNLLLACYLIYAKWRYATPAAERV